MINEMKLKYYVSGYQWDIIAIDILPVIDVLWYSWTTSRNDLMRYSRDTGVPQELYSDQERNVES